MTLVGNGEVSTSKSEGAAITVEDGGTLTIGTVGAANGPSLVSKGKGGSGVASNAGNIIVNSGTVQGDYGIVYANLTGTSTQSNQITVAGGEVISNADNGIAIFNIGADITVSGGKISANSAVGSCAIYNMAGNLDITNGEISGYNAVAAIGNGQSNCGNVTISGGQIKATSSAIINHDDELADEQQGGMTISITGGKFSNDVTEFIDSSLYQVEGPDIDGMYVVTLSSGASVMEDTENTLDSQNIINDTENLIDNLEDIA